MAEYERAYLWHKDIDAGIEVPDEPDVIKEYEHRGWQQVERPVAVPFIPAANGIGGRKLDPKDYTPAPVSAPESKKVNK